MSSPDASPAGHAATTDLVRPGGDNSFVETVQSLIVAFVLAMTFRGFITEGFVIPTGSMAPTLLGEHKRLLATQTGWDFATGFDRNNRERYLERVADPMLGPGHLGSGTRKTTSRTRMGDRILVLKSLYRFSEPDRFDVVVFKNPTNPNGDDGNYIKRLIGLPNEALWLVDGDVFVGRADDSQNFDEYEIQRKPDYIQRAVWQPVYDSDFFPLHPERLDTPYRGAPWVGDHWETEARGSYRCETADRSLLEWNVHERPVTDWAPYNALSGPTGRNPYSVGDVRVAGAIVPDEDGMSTTLEIEVQGYVMQFILADGTAQVRMRSSEFGDDFPDENWEGPAPQAVDALSAGRPTNVEFWHVDQRLALFVDGSCVAEHLYDWRPRERLENAMDRKDDPGMLATRSPVDPTKIRWRFEGSPATVHRVRVDRDLYYRTDRLTKNARKNPVLPRFAQITDVNYFGFGTHPRNLAILGPDHFFMAGDNSTASSDSRLWGSPHPLVSTQIDPHPFVVHRKLMLGKAWVVYFPAPHPLTEGGKSFIPDFGRLRFIR